MSDKLRQGISVVPEFVGGEQPTGAKLTSITAQMRRAAEKLEEAVGDIHGGSYPYGTNTTTLSPYYGRHRTNGTQLTTTAERRLDIANLARLIGPASNMNVRTLHDRTLTDDVPIGVHEFTLRFVPKTPGDVIFDVPAVFATYVADPTILLTAGQYHVSDKGKVYCVSITTGGTATYLTSPKKYGGGQNPQGARFNVIPDPNQISAGGVGISWGAPDASGRRVGTLPTVTHTQSNWGGTATALTDDDMLFGQQLRVPKLLTNNFTAGEQIPPGFMFVKNETTGEVYEDGECFYDTNTTVTFGGVDITTAINAGNQFSIITVGTDITSSIDDLRVKAYHSHDRKFGEPFVELEGITGILETAGASGPFVPSGVPGNFAPQYLHRDGWINGVDANLNDENAMRGDLMMANVDLAQGARAGVSGGTSARVRFGSTGADGAYIYKDSSEILRYNASSADSEGHMFMLGEVDRIEMSDPLGAVPPRMKMLGMDIMLDSSSGLTGDPAGAFRCRPYFASGSFPVGAGPSEVIVLPSISATITSGTIIACEVMLERPGVVNTWNGPNELGPTQFSVGLTDTANLPFLDLTGTDYLNEPAVNFRVMIWWE